MTDRCHRSPLASLGAPGWARHLFQAPADCPKIVNEPSAEPGPAAAYSRSAPRGTSSLLSGRFSAVMPASKASSVGRRG